MDWACSTHLRECKIFIWNVSGDVSVGVVTGYELEAGPEGFFYGRQSGQGVKLTSHFHLVPTLRIVEL
jgi:hypothetical protein